MTDLTPTDTGYSLHGNTDAEIHVTSDGIKIRAKGKRNAPWRFMSWADLWMSAMQENA